LPSWGLPPLRSAQVFEPFVHSSQPTNSRSQWLPFHEWGEGADFDSAAARTNGARFDPSLRVSKVGRRSLDNGCFRPESGHQFAGAMPFARVRLRPVNVRRRTLQALPTLKKGTSYLTGAAGRKLSSSGGASARPWCGGFDVRPNARAVATRDAKSVGRSPCARRDGPIARRVDVVNVARFGYVWPSAELAVSA